MTGYEIVSESLRATRALYSAWLLERARIFDVADRIVELVERGLLPLGAGHAGDSLQRYAESVVRLTTQERAELYARAFGASGGESGGNPDHDFADLWLRFVSSVALLQPHTAVDGLLGSHPRVRGAAYALAARASSIGRKLAPAASRLSAATQAALALLRDPEIAQAVGARDMWQVIDEVGTNALGGAAGTARYRTFAEAGDALLRWLAEHSKALAHPVGLPTDPSSDDVNLMNAVEQWVAASGICGSAVAQQSQPTESPSTPSSPIDVPALAHDLLDAIGATGGLLPRGTVLFHGAADSGKTLAAYLVAGALDVAILRIDLGRVVSKYIGETERNLDAILARAQEAGALLLFDEADALFGMRTEVSDTHDRYAILDIGDLPQRIAGYGGTAIVATNPGSRLDDLFADERWRRLHATVRFPRPRP